MKHAGLLLVLLSFASGILAQDYARLTAVQTTATVSKKPINSIALHWPDDMAASKWTVYKQNDSGRFVFKKTINAPDTSYTDLDVKTGERYTYLIYKEDVNHVLGFGIITAGIESKAPFSHGGCLLVVEDSVNMQLNAEIKRLQNDIEHEGWQTQLLVVSSKKTVSEIKAEIVKAYGASDSSLAAVLLIGKIAVPYSGNMAPDGHTPFTTPKQDHMGAWAADVFYADIDGEWTDKEVNTQNSPMRSATINKPNDGKYDQSFLPSDADLMLGRIYLEKLRSFEKNRFAAYKRYLDKNHAFRTSAYSYRGKALINDDFTGNYEGFAGIGFRNFSHIVGNNQIDEGSLLSHALNNSYLIAYGCGSGDYDKCGNMLRNGKGQKVDSFSVSQSSDYFEYDIKCGFNMMFGSFFGDWDSKNCLLRAPLAGNDPALATFWAGRPVWHLNDFSHGLPLGYSVLTSQNTDFYLFNGIESNNLTYQRMVHIALMGDPTLNLRNLPPAKGLVLSTNEERDKVMLTWTANSGSGVQYKVYRKSVHKDSLNWQLLTENAIADNYFTDTLPYKGSSLYRIVPVKMHKGHTGSYEICGQYAQDSISNIKGTVAIAAVSALNVSLYPNPTNGLVLLNFNKEQSSTDLTLYSPAGEVLLKEHISKKMQTQLSLAHLANGIYFLTLSNSTESKVFKINKIAQ